MNHLRSVALAALILLAGNALAQGAISGTVYAPVGGDVYGTYVIACPPTPDGQECQEDGVGFVQIGQSGAYAPFEIRDLASRSYLVVAWQDTNGDYEMQDDEPVSAYTVDDLTPTQVTPPSQNIMVQFLTGEGDAIAASQRVSGTITAPAGGDVNGTTIILCVPTNDGCDENISVVYEMNSARGARAVFEMAGVPGTVYYLMAYKDLNGNNSMDAGDYLGTYLGSDGAPAAITVPMQNINVTLSLSGADNGSSSTASAAAPTNITPVGNSDAAAIFDGEWSHGSVSSVNFYNSATGAWAPPSGSGSSYTFNPDGSYVRSGLLQSSLYSCTTTIFSYQTGRFLVENNLLTLQQDRNLFKSQDNCNARWNYEREDPLETEYYSWEFGSDSYGTYLLLRDLILTDQGLDYDPDYDRPTTYRYSF